MAESISLRARCYLTLLHLPTTTSILSLITVSSLVSPTFHWDRFLLILAEACLMVGLAGNYLDEAKGRPWMTTIPTPVLWSVGVVALLSSSAIGFYISTQVGFWFVPFVLTWGFLTVSYSLELFTGIFHNTCCIVILVALASLGASLAQNLMLTWSSVGIAGLSGIIAGYGRQHYELGKPAGKDGEPFPSARRAWHWLMLEVIFIDAVATITLISRALE